MYTRSDDGCLVPADQDVELYTTYRPRDAFIPPGSYVFVELCWIHRLIRPSENALTNDTQYQRHAHQIFLRLSKLGKLVDMVRRLKKMKSCLRQIFARSCC